MRMRIGFLPAVGAVALAAAGPAAAQQRDWGMMHHDMGWGGWLMGPLMMLLFFGLLVAAAVFVVRLLASGGAGRREDRSLDHLRERFARGEIDREEFEERRKLLER